MNNINFQLDSTSGIPKFQQLIDLINNSISQKELQVGDALPSVNQICKQCNLSRDTVVKAYSELKRRGIIESVPNKGYYVSQDIIKVFLFLDTFKAYKEVLYYSFLNSLPKNVVVDVNFHHYNYKVFETLVLDSIGKYSKYIIMNFDNKKIIKVLKKINQDNLLIIDWKIYADEEYSFICQDFGQTVYDNLEKGLHLLEKYNELVFIYPNYTYHPWESVEFFKKFCKDRQIRHKVVLTLDKEEITPGKAFISLEDNDLLEIIDTCKSMKYEIGNHVGILSYNETPMKRVIVDGITVISTDFVKMGKRIADYIKNNEKVKEVIPTSLIIRESL